MSKSLQFKNKLKIARTIKDLTQAELADLVGVSRQTIISIEKGDYVPSTLLSLTIAHVLDTDINEIFYLLPIDDETAESQT